MKQKEDGLNRIVNECTLWEVIGGGFVNDDDALSYCFNRYQFVKQQVE